jgi:glycosyltransferase involved in cell wall biosynthesis
LVNDCSTDNTANLINDYKKSDNRIKIINNKSNKGVGYCRKIGFEKLEEEVKKIPYGI